MPTADELLNLIAQATAQLNGLKKLPDEEPTGDTTRFFRCDLEMNGSVYTYVLLRVPDGGNDWGGCWYVTGTLIGSSRPWVRWTELRKILTKYVIKNWIELVPKVEPLQLPNSLED